ncbi:hypothetical protein PVAP13_1NG022078 [Panicum virgatum]|uniref:Uncharacterized protein n=1 Tax=Panicum virgatum TaxID=38727 RepID=A0A8T0WSA4_PANVG|nr:hypothetical protein PVAP13_1NG022078 [Panicum virgatum]
MEPLQIWAGDMHGATISLSKQTHSNQTHPRWEARDGVRGTLSITCGAVTQRNKAKSQGQALPTNTRGKVKQHFIFSH